MTVPSGQNSHCVWHTALESCKKILRVWVDSGKQTGLLLALGLQAVTVENWADPLGHTYLGHCRTLNQPWDLGGFK